MSSEIRRLYKNDNTGVFFGVVSFLWGWYLYDLVTIYILLAVSWYVF